MQNAVKTYFSLDVREEKIHRISRVGVRKVARARKIVRERKPGEIKLKKERKLEREKA